MGTCTEPDEENLAEQRKLITAILIPVISDWWKHFGQHKESSAKSNLLRSTPPRSSKQIFDCYLQDNNTPWNF